MTPNSIMPNPIDASSSPLDPWRYDNEELSGYFRSGITSCITLIPIKYGSMSRVTTDVFSMRSDTGSTYKLSCFGESGPAQEEIQFSLLPHFDNEEILLIAADEILSRDEGRILLDK